MVNKNHYITADLDLNATITGFNDVTPKPGSQRLVAMADGKPVLTVWRYGLGRVARSLQMMAAAGPPRSMPLQPPG